MPAKWKIPKEAKVISISVDNALSMANFWQSIRMDEDDDWFDRWLDGSVTYEQLQNYYQGRFGSAVGTKERAGVKTKLEEAEEKQSDTIDDFWENQFYNGSVTYNQYKSYIDGRLTGENEGTEDWERLNNRKGGALEYTRVAEENLWQSQYQYGEMSYEDFEDKFKQRRNLYASNSTRYASISDVLLKSTPDYLLREAENKFLSYGYSPNFDTKENYNGYQNDLRSILNKFTKGSVQYSQINNMITQVGWKMADYQSGVDLRSLENKVNQKYLNMTNNQNDFENKRQIYENNPTDKNYDNWMKSYTAWQNSALEYSNITDQYNNLKSQLNDPASYFTPEWLSNILGVEYVSPTTPPTKREKPLEQEPSEFPKKEEEPKEKEPKEKKPKAPAAPWKPPTGSVYIPTPDLLKYFTSGEILREPGGKRTYLSSNTIKERRIPNPSYLKYYKDTDLIKFPGGQIYIKKGVQKRW